MLTTRQQATVIDYLLNPQTPRRPSIERQFEGIEMGASLLADILWPALAKVDLLRRDDSIPEIRANRAAQRIGILARLRSPDPPVSSRGRLTAIIVCGETPAGETSADIVAAFLETMQIDVRLCGGGVPVAEIVDELELRPVDLLVIVSIEPHEAPAMRQMMNRVRAMNRSIRPRIVAGGGLFARADELALEMGADVELVTLWQFGDYFGHPDQPDSAALAVHQRRDAA